ncbi:MAG: TIGR01906 family membrane protein [Oscillospiraceae bacterium]|nr:TIGR01906 family membrane protein [Oscillospiraceae bacterium]
MKKGKLLAILLSIALALFTLSAAIAAPLLCRPFYYAQIAPLDLETAGGISEAEIRAAYDEMMDYCLGISEEFGTGVLPYSEEGASHFADVRALFLLDLRVLSASAAALLVLWVGMRAMKLRPHRFLQRGASFWAACGLGALFAVVGGACAVNFTRAFELFHAIAFPGKTNWLFDPELDAIIRILPEEFFFRCAVLILALLLVGCVLLLLAGRKRRRAA